jgi:transposase
METAVKDNLRK